MVNTYPLMEIFPGELSSEKTEWLLLRGIKKESLFYFPLFPIDTSSQCIEYFSNISDHNLFFRYHQGRYKAGSKSKCGKHGGRR